MERNTKNIAYGNMFYIRSINLFLLPLKGWRDREKSSSNNFELDFKAF